MKINGNEIRQGYILEYQGKLWRAVKAQQVQMGNWRSYWQVELKDIHRELRYSKHFDRTAIRDLLTTTYRAARKREREKAESLAELDVTFSYRLARYAPR